MPKLLIFDAFTLLIPEKTVANYALLRCKTFSLKIWVCKIFDKYHVCSELDNLLDFLRFNYDLCNTHVAHLRGTPSKYNSRHGICQKFYTPRFSG